MRLQKATRYLAATVGLFAAVVFCGGPAHAGLIVFDDESAFRTHVFGESWRIFTEGFESAVPGQYKTGSPSLDLHDLTLSSSRFTVEDDGRFVTEGERAIKAVPGGWGSGDSTWTSSFNDYGPVTLAFDRPIHFLGVDISDLGTSRGESLLRARLDGGAPTELLRQGMPYGSTCDDTVQECNNDYLGTTMFVGVVSDLPFSTLEFDLVEGDALMSGGFVKDDYVGFDRLQFGGTAYVPVPPTLALIGLGAGILLVVRRRASVR